MTPRRVVATGTFDILHPGHLYYLSESKKLGDELFVIVARDANVKHKPHPILPEEQRRAMIAALKPVDHAILGDRTDMFRPIEEIRPISSRSGSTSTSMRKNCEASWRSGGFMPMLSG